MAKYNNGYCGYWTLHGLAFGKIIKANQKGDILTSLKLEKFWNWINGVTNGRDNYKAPKNQIFRPNSKSKWKPLKTIFQSKNVCKSQIWVLLQNRGLF